MGFRRRSGRQVFKIYFYKVMMNQEIEVVFNRRVSRETFFMGLRSEQVVGEARPGQFVMIRVTHEADPLLRRPFSISGTRGHDLFFILYRVVGRGTSIMSGTREGERLGVLGPLGKGFDLPKGRGQSLLVAGGIGVAPLIFLAQSIKTGDVVFMTGYGSADEIVPIKELGLTDKETLISTEDGEAGHQGVVTDLLERRLSKIGSVRQTVYSCGPVAMLKRVASLTFDLRIPCQVSLETSMACGLGACQGCAVRASSKENSTYYHVCHDGPVFGAESVDWDILCT
jgi:dihydroorotate dehydrogenase electron transfer subunit